MMIIFHKEPVEIEVVGGDSSEDGFITLAYWTKSGVDLTEEELISLTHERPDVISEMLMEKAVERAEAHFDFMMER